jgi:hypothetical protein
MTTHERERGRVRLYACGGGGINVGHKIDHLSQTSLDSFASLDVVYLDTSKSNLHHDIAEDSVYLIKNPNADGDKDGSGQERRTNYEDIAAQTRGILQRFKPADLNIVLSTGGGGSGSVIAPSIMSELLDQDFPTVGICIGDDSTRKFALNSQNTLKSYEKIATIRQRPVSLAFLQNSPEMTRAVIDLRVQHLVTSLCLLFSRRNRELDNRDLYNWLNYQIPTSYKPALTALTLVSDLNPQALAKLGNLISIATLGTSESDTALPIRPEVQFVGFIDDAAAKTLEVKAPLHFVISDGIIGQASAGFGTVLKEAEQQNAARITNRSIVSSADHATDNGLVL